MSRFRLERFFLRTEEEFRVLRLNELCREKCFFLSCSRYVRSQVSARSDFRLQICCC